MAAKKPIKKSTKKITKIKTTKPTKTNSETSKVSAKSLVKQIEKKIVILQNQMRTLSQLRKTSVQLSGGNMKNLLNQPLNEKEAFELIGKMQTTLKGLNIKPSGT